MTSPLHLRFGAFEVDESDARLLHAGQAVDLQPRAFAVLCELARQPGRLVTKDALLDAVWGHRHVTESVLKTVISQLRAALADDAREPRCIETVSRRGYRFIAPVAPADGASPPAAGPAAAPGPAEPVAPTAAPTAPLHGRAAALDTLRAAFTAAQGGRRQTLLVAGEAGIGKSALVETFVAGAAPAAVAFGQCVELYGPGEPYMPVLEALNMLCRADDDAHTVALLRQVAPTWLAQLPWLHDEADRAALRTGTAGATSDRMLREFGEFVDRWTAQRPLVLVLEDLHWSDHATVQLIATLSRRRTPAALLLLGTFRPAELIASEHPFASVRHELRVHRLCGEIDLEALAEADVGDLAAARLGGEAAEDFVRALHAHTGGLPLYVAHVLDELVAAGSLQREPPGLGPGRWIFPPGGAFGVPGTIAGLVERQAARLPAGKQRLLEAASVAGTEFTHLALAAPLQLEADAVCSALDAVVAQGQWLRALGPSPLGDGRHAVRYAFRHALLRQALYERTGAAQRMRWHREIAAALLRSHGAGAAEVAAELAMHFELGGEPLAAAAQLAIVAARAVARSAAPETLRATGHGLELLAAAVPPSSPEDEASRAALELELRVLEGLALSRTHVISEPAVATAFDRACVLADRAGPGPSRARALYGRWRVSFARAELARAQQLAQHMLQRAGSDDPALASAARSALGSTLAMRGEFAAAKEQLEAVLADEAGGAPADGALGIFVQDPGVVARGYLALVLWWMGAPARARTLADAAVARAAELHHPLSQLIGLNLAALVHFYAGEPQRVLTLVDELYEVIRRHDLPTAPGPFSWLRGHVVAQLGDVDAGLAEMRAAEQSCLRNGMLTGLTGYYRHFAEAACSIGRLDEAAAAVERGLAAAASSGEQLLKVPLLRLGAEVALARGDTDAAAALLGDALDVARAQGARFHEIGLWVVASRLPDPPPALATGRRERLGELLAPFSDDTAPVLRPARQLLQALGSAA